MHYYERKGEIFEFLRLKNCCLRCCLRFCGVITMPTLTLPELFRNPELTSKELGYLKDGSEFTNNCLTCLGILQDEMIEKSIDKIVSTCQTTYKDASKFNCALTTPVSTFIRDRAMQIRVIKEFEISDEDTQAYKKSLLGLKDVWRWCAYPKLQKLLEIKAGYPACNGLSNCIGCVKCIPSLTIDLFFAYKDDENECKRLKESYGKESQSKRSKDTFSRKGVENILNDMSDEQFVESSSMNLNAPNEPAEVEKVVCAHDSIFIGGRYTKLSRKLCQTPWHINGEKKMQSSVQEVIFGGIDKHIQTDLMKFLSSGREDVDVRMLYNGRPFAIELFNPRSPKITDQILSNIISEVNQCQDVQIVSKMKVLTRDDLKKLKKGENEKTKNYRAVCAYKSKPHDPELLEKLNAIKDLEIIQKTPLRVLHRRPLAARSRTIHSMQARPLRGLKPTVIPQNWTELSPDIDDLFVIDVQTQAGTYVKEFVHGDFGRTKPNLCDLLEADVDIMALDVTGINLQWP